MDIQHIRDKVRDEHSRTRLKRSFGPTQQRWAVRPPYYLLHYYPLVIIYTLMTLNFLSLLSPLNSPPTLYTCKPQSILSPSGCLPISSHSISLKLNFFLSVSLFNSLKSLILLFSCQLMSSSNQLTQRAILALSLILHYQCPIIIISSVSKSCFLSIRDLRRIRNTLDYSTANTIATSLIHSKLDYCNSLFLNLPQSQLGRLQLILNSAARAVSQTPKFSHITPVLKSLHWLKIEQRIQYKVLSITYKTLQSGKLSYLHNLLNVLSNRLTRSSDILTLQRPPVRSRLKLTDRSFTHYAPVLWNTT